MDGKQTDQKETKCKFEKKSTKIEKTEFEDIKETNFVEEQNKQDQTIVKDKQNVVFQCLECKKFFRSDHALKAHDGQKHSKTQEWSKYAQVNGDQYKCMICEKDFIRRKISTHIKITHKIGAKLQCPDCDKLFYYRADLKTHSVVHTQIQVYTCDECGQSFKSESTCIVHKRKKHLSEEEQAKYRNHICSDCGKTFFNKSTLLDHSARHGADFKIPCSQCDKLLRSKGELSMHVRKVHRGYKQPPVTEEAKVKNRINAVKTRADKKLKNGGVLRTPEEKQTFNAYMKNYNKTRRQKKLIAVLNS